MTIKVYDATGVPRLVNPFKLYDAAGTLRTVSKGHVYDASGVPRQFYSAAPPNVLAGTMVAGTSTNFVGFSKSPATPTFGSCTPALNIGDFNCCYMGSISISAELEVSFNGLTDPGQSLFTSWVDGLGNTRPSSGAVYSYSATTKIARWRYTTAGVDYVNGNSYNVSFNV